MNKAELKLVEDEALGVRSDYEPINDYGMIGDLHTGALVSSHGGIDWLCAPFFDSPSLFARILDADKGGTFRIAPTEYETSYNSYLMRTNILKTSFIGESSRVSLYDFQVIGAEDGSKPDPGVVRVCRILECERGLEVPVTIEFDPRPNYATESADLVFESESVYSTSQPIWLNSSTPIEWDEETHTGRLVLSHGDRVELVFSYGKPLPEPEICNWIEDRFFETRSYWESWIGRSLYKGRWRAAVERSALTLKMLTFQPTGAVLAALTTSLPEELGGERNWDYRFSWIRDSALTLNALLLLGFHDEADAFLSWLMSRCLVETDAIQILYPIGDWDTTRELELTHLEGYKGSKPVRIGNAATSQLQLDVFGELIESIYLFGIYGEKTDMKRWAYVRRVADDICEKWHLPDEGIWEVRGGRFNFTYSKLMCWLGLDCAIRMAEEEGFAGDVPRWKSCRAEITEYLLESCVHPTEGYFMQSAESEAVDAANLLIPRACFLPPEDDRVQRTIDKTIEQVTKNGHVFRYRSDDGLSGEEGAFNICTFWLIESLALSGRLEEAHDHFLKVLEACGSCGLLAEETCPDKGTALGNYPQAFSHIGLINAALTLEWQRKTGGGRAS
ncbi:MAG: glycoside hydrolase family 15 protein [Acidobacteriota bacterium]